MNQSNNQFIFDGKTKMLTLALTAVGLVCLAITFATDSEYDYTRFWTNLLHNAVFFTGISLAALFFICVHTMAWGGWHVIFKRIPEAMMMFLPVGIILIGVVALATMMETDDAVGAMDLLYLWSDENALKTDKLLQHKSSFLNPMIYLLTLAVLAVWTFFAWKLRTLSVQQDSSASLSQPNLIKSRFWAAIFLPIAGFSSAFVIWQWVMSIDAHWYSTLFAWYASISLWVSAICIMLLIAVFLKSRGHLPQFTNEHMHDLGKYIFGFSVFWTYLWFSQFMLIWYANNGEETQYFFLRFEQFKPLFFINLGMNFLLPFFTLMMNSSKRTLGTVGFVAGAVCFGHWVDYFQMIKPGVWYNYEHAQHAKHATPAGEHGKGHTYNLDSDKDFDGGKPTLTYYQNPHPDQHGNPNDTTSTTTDTTGHPHTDTTMHGGGDTHTPTDNHGDTHGDGDHHAADAHGHGHAHEHQFVMGIHFPGLLEVGTMLGFLGLFLFVTFTFLSKASLYPQNDPFLGESEHHHT